MRDIYYIYSHILLFFHIFNYLVLIMTLKIDHKQICQAYLKLGKVKLKSRRIEPVRIRAIPPPSPLVIKIRLFH